MREGHTGDESKNDFISLEEICQREQRFPQKGKQLILCQHANCMQMTHSSGRDEKEYNNSRKSVRIMENNMLKLPVILSVS